MRKTVAKWVKRFRAEGGPMARTASDLNLFDRQAKLCSPQPRPIEALRRLRWVRDDFLRVIVLRMSEYVL
jgi:hypothetical protein